MGLGVCLLSLGVHAQVDTHMPPHLTTVKELRSYGVFTLAYSGTGTGTGTGTGKNGLYDIMQNVSHYTGTGTGQITGKNTNGCYTHFSGPENLSGDEL